MIPIDIRESEHESFVPLGTLVLDTNVILFAFYEQVPQAETKQRSYYSSLISKAIENGTKLIITSATLSELVNAIEKNEHRLYNYKYDKRISIKQFREIEIERKRVVDTTDLIYRQICSIPNIEIIDSIISKKSISSYVSELKNIMCNFFDYYLVGVAEEEHYSIVTDDFDFSLVSWEGYLLSANQKFFAS